MPLVFAAITPHTPLLLESIGKERATTSLAKTNEALELLEQELYVSKPDVIIVISPHEGRFEDTFVVNAHTTFEATFESFGDTVTKHTYRGTPDLAAKISHIGNHTNFPVRLISDESLSHGASVPLAKMTSHLEKTTILPIGFSNREVADHIRFGEILKEIILDSHKKVAVIASGDLAHCLTNESPVPYNEHGSQFDEQFIELLQTTNTVGLMTMDKEMIAASHECGYRSLLILLGIIKDMDYQFKNYSYEHPFGVGYLVGNFTL